MPARNVRERGERLEERLLHEVLGVGGVARHPQRGPVELVQQRHRVALEPGGALLRGLVLLVDHAFFDLLTVRGLDGVVPGLALQALLGHRTPLEPDRGVRDRGDGRIGDLLTEREYAPHLRQAFRSIQYCVHHDGLNAGSPTRIPYPRGCGRRGDPGDRRRCQKAGVEYRLHAYGHGAGAAYGPEAGEALGLDPARVFKTLVAEVDGALTVGVVPVAAKLDLKALAAAVGGKRAKMAEVAAAERATGYVAGGISPLGQRKRLPTVVDASAEGYDTMFCSAGRRGLEVELAPADLTRLTGATYAPLAVRE